MIEAIVWILDFPARKKHAAGITQGMTGSSSASSSPPRLCTIVTLGLLLSAASSTHAAAFISSDPAPKAFHVHNNNNNSSISNPSVNIKLSAESGTVQPYYNYHDGGGQKNSDSSQYYDDEYYYDDNVAYSEEDLENVADSDDLHSHYFVKTNANVSQVYVKNLRQTEEILVAVPENENSRPVTVTTNLVTTTTEPTIPAAESAAAATVEDNEGSESVAGIGVGISYITHAQSPEIEASPAAVNNLIPTDDDGSESDLSDTSSTSIPGTPGIDYPIFGEVPYTEFDCQKQRYKGFFADLDTQCQAWHYCDFSDGHSAFLCPNGTLFSQVLLTCDWWFNVNCKEAQQLYVLNERLYRYNKFPKPSFPEDFHGPQVDLWLIEQLQLGHLPKKRKLVMNKTVVSGSN